MNVLAALVCCSCTAACIARAALSAAERTPCRLVFQPSTMADASCDRRSYPLQFMGPAETNGNGAWMNTLAMLHGLDGISAQDEIVGSFHDPAVVAKYQQFERRRGYEIKD